MLADEQSATFPLKSSFGLRLIRAGWVCSALLCLAILLVAVPGYLGAPFLGIFGDYLILTPGTLAYDFAQATLLLSFLSAAISLGLALFLFYQKSTEPMGLFVAYYLLGHAILFAGPIEMLYPLWPAAPLVNSFVLLPVFFGPATAALIGLFPDGRFVPRWSRWLIPVSLAMVPGSLLNSENFLTFQLPDMVTAFLYVIFITATVILVVAAVYSQVYRYRNVSTTVQKLQTKWVLYGLAFWAVINGVASAGWSLALQLPEGAPVPTWFALSTLLWVGSTLILPVSLTLSITRYRLFEIDLIINRTLVYGALTASVLLIYVVAVGALGLLFQAQNNPIVVLLATGLVAVLFQPLRQRLQAAVNRLFYGQRDDPLLTLAQLGRRLEAAIAPELVLPTLVETIAHTLKLPYVAISLQAGDAYVVAAAAGTNGGEVSRIPLVYRGETVGQLIVGQRGPGERLSAADARLLAHISHQAGPSVYAVQLTQALRRSRVRLVTAREEERRRLRRDLHDGLGPILASQGLKIAAAGQLLSDEPERAGQLLSELAAQNAATVAEIRRLVYELRPPALDELGLVGAVRDYAANLKGRGQGEERLRVTVTAPAGDLPAMPAAVEVAAFRIVTEALTNVVRHAGARRAAVTFAIHETANLPQLSLEIDDDGGGLAPDYQSGVGLISMRERAEEVGGSFRIESTAGQGVQISARLPLPEAA